MKVAGKRTRRLGKLQGKISNTESTEFERRGYGDNMIQSGGRYRVVLVTCGSIGEARKIGHRVVERKLAACANILPGVESIYRWKGRVERGREVLVVMKTSSKRLRELEREVKRMHSYDVPEFIVLPIVAGSREYLDWVGENIH
jgi:periplasmic divalent cation tolerance protein